MSRRIKDMQNAMLCHVLLAATVMSDADWLFRSGGCGSVKFRPGFLSVTAPWRSFRLAGRGFSFFLS